MKLVEKISSDAFRDRNDDSDYYALLIDGKEQISFKDGEIEDNLLARNFNDVYKIVELMELAYEAGKQGEEFKVKQIEVDDC